MNIGEAGSSMPPMIISTNKTDLLAALGPAVKATGRGDKNNKMLTCVLIEADKAGGVTITGTDMMLTMASRAVAEGQSVGALCVPGGQLLKIVSTMPAGGIQLTGREGNWLELKSTAPKAKVAVKLQGYPASDFPLRDVVPDGPAVKVDAAALRLLLDAVFYAACVEETRVNLCVVHLEREGKTVHAVTTDGHRMAHASAVLPFPAMATDAGANIPRHSARVLLGLLVDGECELRFTPHFVVLQVGAVRAVAKLADVIFPPWRTVFPTEHAHTCILPRSAVQPVLDRALAMACDLGHLATFRFNVGANGAGELAVSAENPDTGAMSDAVADGVRATGDGTHSGMNAAYVSEAVSHLAGSSIAFKLNGGLNVALLEGEGEEYTHHFAARALVMPMRS